MAIPDHLLKTATYGDFERIADIYNRRKTSNTSGSYARRIAKGEVNAKEGTMASEIRDIAEKYLSMKYELNRKLVEA